MVAKTLSQLLGGNIPKLAVDTDFPKDKPNGVAVFTVLNINAVGGLTTILSLTGKFAIHALWMSGLTGNNIATVKLTIDGVVVWNVDPLTNTTVERYIGSALTDGNAWTERLMCETSFLWEMEMDSDTTIHLNYAVRPIL